MRPRSRPLATRAPDSVLRTTRRMEWPRPIRAGHPSPVNPITNQEK